MIQEGSTEGWVEVTWDNGDEYQYRWGADDAFDLEVIPDEQPVAKDEVGHVASVGCMYM